MIDNQFKIKGLLVWGICALFFLYEFSLRTVIGTYQCSLMQDLGLTYFQFSLLSATLFSLSYGLMQIPVGIIVDKFGLKKPLFTAAICCGISAIGFACSYSYPIAIAYRVLMGFGASFGFVCLLIAVYDWMPHRYIALFIGLSQFIGTLGPMMVAGPLDSMSEYAGVNWRLVFLYLGGIGFILAVLIFFLVENNHQKAGKYTILHKPEKVTTSLLRLFTRIQPWYIAIFSASLYFTVEYFSETEGRALLGLKGISLNSSSYMISIGWIGYAIGCPLLGFLSDVFERRKIIMQACAALGLIAILMILYLSNRQYLQLAFLLLGASAGGQSIGFATVTEQFKKQFVAVGFGLNNAMITIFSAVNAPLIGGMLDYIKQGESVSLTEYLLVFKLLIVIVCGALILATFFIKETYCKTAVDFTILKPSSM